MHFEDFPGGAVVKNPPANTGDKGCGFDPWVRKIPGGGNDNPSQYSHLGNSMDTGAWWATVLGVARSPARLSTCTDLL